MSKELSSLPCVGLGSLRRKGGARGASILTYTWGVELVSELGSVEVQPRGLYKAQKFPCYSWGDQVSVDRGTHEAWEVTGSAWVHCHLQRIEFHLIKNLESHRLWFPVGAQRTGSAPSQSKSQWKCSQISRSVHEGFKVRVGGARG